eukprot:4849480-Prymnesium_polylepis.1
MRRRAARRAAHERGDADSERGHRAAVAGGRHGGGFREQHAQHVAFVIEEGSVRVVVDHEVSCRRGSLACARAAAQLRREVWGGGVGGA